MKRVFILFALSLLVLSPLVSSQAMACRCTNPGPKNAYARADAVVLVRIKAVEQVQEEVARMETEVIQSWKSKAAEETNTLAVFSETSACSYVGKEGETHLLYLNKYSGPPEGFWTGNCKGDLPESHPQAAKHIQWLNRHGRKM